MSIFFSAGLVWWLYGGGSCRAMLFWPRNGLKVAVLSLSIFLKSGLRPRFFHMIVYFGSLAVA